MRKIFPLLLLFSAVKNKLLLFETYSMGFLVKVLVTAVAAYVAAHILPGVKIKDVQTTVIVAFVLALLNTFIKPILVILTIPVTILTLGLFLLIINALMVKWASMLVEGFWVRDWLSALLFSLIVSVVSYFINSIISEK